MLELHELGVSAAIRLDKICRSDPGPITRIASTGINLQVPSSVMRYPFGLLKTMPGILGPLHQQLGEEYLRSVVTRNPIARL